MSSILLLFPFFLFSFCSFVQITAAEDTYVAAGHIYCTTTGLGPNEPVNQAGVVFLEDDSGFFMNLDDRLGHTYSNAKGQFNVSGSTGEGGEEELYLMIWHRCPKEGTGLPPNKKCQFGMRVDLDQILNDDGPFAVNDLEIYLGKNIAQSGNTTLPMTPYREDAIC